MMFFARMFYKWNLIWNPVIDRMAHDIPRVAHVDGQWVISKHECTIV